MAVQDLTPQLRTRLNRLEKLVGIFVTVATLLLFAGLGYYVYHMAQRKGWFTPKINYQTSLKDATGLNVGDPVRLMGFDVGEITKIEANGPYDYYNVTVDFRIKAPYYGYLWTNSQVRVASADFLGHRALEVLKGRYGAPTVREQGKNPVGILMRDKVETVRKQLTTTNKAPETVQDEIKTAVAANPGEFYSVAVKTAIYWLEPAESPALTERLETVVNMAQNALPGILDLTNKLAQVLTNAAVATVHVNELLAAAKPVVSNVNATLSNVVVITANLTNGQGSLGDWVLPTNINAQLALLMTNANVTVTNVNTNLVSIVDNLNRSLESLAGITSNLHAQVDANTNIVKELSSAIVNADTMLQGLRRHWLLRGAFKRMEKETNAPAKVSTPGKPVEPRRNDPPPAAQSPRGAVLWPER